VLLRIYPILLGISWKANSSIEKSQNSRDVGVERTDFLEYLLPRLFPSCWALSAHLHHFCGSP
jgi:hypothetical protein